MSVEFMKFSSNGGAYAVPNFGGSNIIGSWHVKHFVAKV